MGLFHGDGLTCIQFPALAGLSGFFHGVFLRSAINGRGEMDAFNLGLGHGTPDGEVWRNREQMLNFFGPDTSGVYARQVHGIDVGVVTPGEVSDSLEANHPLQLHGDALITNVAGTALVIQVADCQPIILVDPSTGVVANIHSGWRGSLQNIIGATVDRLMAEYKCRPEDLVCGIGPSLGPCCAEFINYREEIPNEFWGYRKDGDLFDFWQISIDQCINAGIKPDHISLAGMCTKCNQHLFFSYRGERDTGRFAAVVGIQSVKGSGT